MKIIRIEATKTGYRPPLQEWWDTIPPEGYAFCPDEFVDLFYSTDPAGFVNIIVRGDTVTGMTINQEALDAYIASLPEPEPTPEPVEDVTWEAMAAAITEGVNEV